MNTRSSTMELTPRPRGRGLVVGGTFVLLSVVVASVAFIPNMSIVAMAACNVGAVVAYMGLRADPQSGYLFEVIIPISILNFLYFGVGTIYLGIVPEALDFPALAPYLFPAQTVATLGFLCLLVGYGWFFRQTAPSGLGRYVPRSAMVYIVPGVLGAIGLSVHKFQLEQMLSRGAISASLSFLQQFASLFYFGWFLAWYMYWSGRLRASLALPMLVAMGGMGLLVLFYTFGSKTLALTILGLPALAYYEVRRKLPMKSIVVVVLIFVFIIFPMYNTFRQVNRDLDTSRRLDQTVNLARNWNSNEYLDASLFAFFKRLTVVTSVAAIVSDTGRWIDYRYGETLLLAPIGLFIPRFLWPEKPDISIGREFGDVFRLKNPLDRETEVSPSLVGEFYWNFSLPGVVLGMWLLGMGYRWFYQRYGVGSDFDPIRKSIYATLLPTVLLVEGSVAILICAFIKVLAILVVFLLFSRRLGWLEEMQAT